MKEKKNIDRLFQEKFKDFEETPNPDVWNRIESTLSKKEDHKIVPIWFKLAGVAALLIGFLALGNFIYDNNTENGTLPVVDNTNAPDENSNKTGNNPDAIEKLVESSSDINTDEFEKQVDPSLNLISVDKNSSESVAASSINDRPSSESNQIADTKNEARREIDSRRQTESTSVTKNQTTIASTVEGKSTDGDGINKGVGQDNKLISNPRDTNSTAIAQNKKVEGSEKEKTANPASNLKLEENNSSIAKVEENKESEILDSTTKIEEAIAQTDASEEVEKEEEENANRWNVAPIVAPVYFNAIGQGSPIDGQFTRNSKSGDVTFSYGVQGSYALNKKLKLRLGVNKLDVGYSTNDVFSFNSVNARFRDNNTLRNVRMANSENSNSYMSEDLVMNSTMPDILLSNPKGSLDQEMGFIEIPLEVEYNLVDKKLDVNLIGGFSTLLLDRNEVFTNFRNERVLLGEATNINRTSYSANLGFGVNYNFTKNIDLSVEPTFKYQINTFENSSGEFRPYIIGVYSGIRFKF